MGYENAPATKMMATHCAACGRPLLDARSVEIGMGPDCRKKHGYGENIPEDLRVAANKFIHDVALARSRGTIDLDAVKAAYALRDTGLLRLSEILVDRLAAVKVAVAGNVYEVVSPYREDAWQQWRNVPGARWDKARKLRTVPMTARGALWSALKALYAGAPAIGPFGPFIVGSR